MANFLRLALAKSIGLVIVAWLCAGELFGHPGHGVTPDADSAAHYFLEPRHGLGATVVALFVIVMILRLCWRTDKLRRSD